MRPQLWLHLAGYLTWLVTGIPAVTAIAAGEVTALRALVWAGAFAAFGASFALCGASWAGARSRTYMIGLLGVQTIASLTMVGAGGDPLAAATLVVVAAQLLVTLHPGTAVVWVTVQTLALVAIFGRTMAATSALTLGGAFAGFEVFALATSALAMSERRAREALALSNVELQETRAQLVERSRLAERLGISRDLHDTIGHHLTALSLQLDVASRVADGKAAEHVQRAHAITRLLLSDVRDVVSRLREGGPVDVSAEVRALADAHPAMSIHLEVPAALTLEDDARAQALVRSVQEIMTNAVRHSGAGNLWIALRAQPGGVTLDARDDGRGAPSLRCGNGLKGMRERFEACAGRVEFITALDRGFEVHGFMPVPRPS